MSQGNLFETGLPAHCRSGYVHSGAPAHRQGTDMKCPESAWEGVTPQGEAGNRIDEETEAPLPGEREREEGIDRVEAGASDAFQSEAWSALLHVVGLGKPFTTDDVKVHVSHQPHEPRAWGAIMRAASRAGIVRATDRTRQSNEPGCHRRPKRIWEPA